MKVPFVDLTREWKFLESKFLVKFKQFGRAGHYVLGEEVKKFEDDFAKFCGYKYAVGVSTGLAALETALRAFGVKSGDEVITVANSAVATSLAVSYIGAKPIFCDIGEDFLIDPDKIEALITSKTRAILPVHLFGRVCDMAKINKIAAKHNLVVVEDACQAHGSKFVGAAAVNTKAFSFYPTKNLGALGEAGLVLTNDEKVREYVLDYRNYGQHGRYNHVVKGNNYRIDALHCVLLDIKLQKLTNFVSKRKQMAKQYLKELAKISGIKLSPFSGSSSYHLFVIRVLNGKRDELQKYLKQAGIDAIIHYPIAIHRQPCYKNEYKNLKLEKTDQIQTELLSLPCYPFLTAAELKYVIKNVKAFFSK